MPVTSSFDGAATTWFAHPHDHVHRLVVGLSGVLTATTTATPTTRRPFGRRLHGLGLGVGFGSGGLALSGLGVLVALGGGLTGPATPAAATPTPTTAPW